jgi:glycosyltransferase involved in cell wall biosynthesis
MQLDDILVSVIIPVYNGENFIGRTLTSALAQTHRKIEVIVVDDGSTDRTSAIVEAAAIGDGRIRLFRRENYGVAKARNFGVSQAQGNLIAPLDADDLWHPHKIARQVAAIQASPKIGLAYCWTVPIDENDFIIPPVGMRQPVDLTNVIWEMAENGNFIDCSSNPLFRRSYFEDVGGYDPNLRVMNAQGCEDWKLYLSLAEICEFAVVPEYLVGYRRWTGSMSANIATMERSMECISRWIIDKWPDMPRPVEHQMHYFRYSYLAHVAINSNQFAKAWRYMLKGYWVRPKALFTQGPMFGARVAARMLGVRRSMLPLIWGKPTHFRDFQFTQ